MNKGKILVVDDDRLVLATLTHGLTQAGYEVIDADNGDDAILLARQHKPDLALLDIRMEGKTGFDVAAYLREHCQMPFMFLSAFSDDATVSQVKELGAVAYLVKPLDIGQIVPAVEAAFANLRSRAAANDAAAHALQSKAAASAVKQTTAIAAGMVMQRFGLSRSQAMEHLKAQAGTRGVSLEAYCNQLLQTHESLISQMGSPS